MSPVDLELRRLLIAELYRHLAVLEARPLAEDDGRRAVHALKGAAGLADERDLAQALQRVERRLRDGEPGALDASAALVRTAAERLTKGESALYVEWPEPPDDLGITQLDASLRVQYQAEIHDHLAGIDQVLASPAASVENARALHRHVHTIKGAASSVGDEAMAWFCHGLEERLLLPEATFEAAARVLAEASRWRAVLSLLARIPRAR